MNGRIKRDPAALVLTCDYSPLTLQKNPKSKLSDNKLPSSANAIIKVVH